MFMRFYVSTDIIKEMEFKWKFVPSSKYHGKCSTVNIVYIFAYYVRSANFWNLKFPKNPWITAVYV